MSKEIPLTQGKVAIVDDEDFEELSRYKWCAIQYGKKFYAIRNRSKLLGRGSIHMHSVIAGTPKGMDTDHINGDTLDNRRSNLRATTHQQNMCNRIKAQNNTSGFKGVYWDKINRKWKAQISVNGKYKHLGRFDGPEEAARAYDSAARDLYGEYANVNF